MKRLLTAFIIIMLTVAMLCSCDGDASVKDPAGSGSSSGIGDSVDGVKLPEVDVTTGKINIDEPIVPVEYHFNSYFYTVFKYNEDGEIIGATDYNTRFNTESSDIYERVKNADGTKTLYVYSTNSGTIYDYDANGYCVKDTYYQMSMYSETQKPKDEIFDEENVKSSVTYRYDSLGRLVSFAEYSDKGEEGKTTTYTYNDDNVILSRITTLPAGDVYESYEFTVNDNGDYSQLHYISVFWESDTVSSFEWSYILRGEMLHSKTMKDEHGKKLAFEYEYNDNGGLESINYYHGSPVVPVQYFLGEGAMMRKTDSIANIVFMPLSKALAKQAQE